MGTFTYQGSQFMYNGNSVQLISGAIHYFRIVPEYWLDRLLKLKACGFNTVETYIAWNIHEPKPGSFCFEGMADIVRFIKTAGDLGLFVIVRPSPYICAEWEFGGLPSWLLADSNMKLRCYHRSFLDKVDSYYDVLLPKLLPLLCTNGGPIIAMQIENEYGSYGNDIRYMEYLKQAMIERGVDVLLFTSDGPMDGMLQGGTISGILATVNFGSGVGESFAKLREYQRDTPLMCMEFWNGWFDHWGEKHHKRDAADVADVLEQMLRAQASVNFYMFHGGTNFGFYNGANCQQADSYEPTITSYDYDALLNEAGDPTEKYYSVRSVLSRYADIGKLKLPEPLKKKGYGRLAMSGQADLLSQVDMLSSPVHLTCPEPMEKLSQDYGFIMYTTFISGPREMQELNIQELHDRALIFLNDEFFGVMERGIEKTNISFSAPPEGLKLSILVENMGRVNYGPYLKDCKGITEGVRHGFQFLFHWTIHPLPLEDLSKLVFGEISHQTKPVFYKGRLHIDAPADTFISLDGWNKGVVYINGFNIGRYWNKGPQKALYIPSPLLQEGDNEVIIFELHGTQEAAVEFLESPILG